MHGAGLLDNEAEEVSDLEYIDDGEAESHEKDGSPHTSDIPLTAEPTGTFFVGLGGYVWVSSSQSLSVAKRSLTLQHVPWCACPHHV